MIAEGKAPVEIDQLSRLIGAIEQQINTQEKVIAALESEHNIQAQLVTMQHQENQKAILKLSQSVDNLSESFKTIQPLVQDYERNKNKALGIFIAISAFFTGLGWIISNLPWPKSH